MILLTGKGGYAVDMEAMQAGASMYLTKGETSTLMLERGIRYAIERKRYEQALQASAREQSRLASFPEMNPNPIVELDLGGNILYANPHARMLFPDLLEKGSSHDFLEGWKAIIEVLRLANEMQHIRDVQVECRTYQQSVFFSDEYQLIRFYGMDITARVHAEQAHEAARIQATQDKNRLEAVMQVLPVGVAITDANGGNIQANPAFERVWGGATRPAKAVEDYVAYQAWWADSGKQLKPEEWASARAVMKGEGVLGQMLEIQRFDGTRAFILNSAMPVRDENGGIVGSAVAVQDVSELRRVEQALKASEHKFKHIFEKSAFAAALTRLSDGIFIDVNQAFEKIVEYTREELLGKTTLALKMNPDADRREKIYSRLKEAGSLHDLEIAFITKSGQQRLFSVNIDRIDIDGEAYLLNTGIDITERKQMEAALRRSAASLNRAQEIAHLGSWELELAENRLTWSDEVYRIFGLEPQEFAATYDAFLERVHPDDRDAVDSAYSNSIREGKVSYEIVHRIVQKSTGEVRTVLERCEHIRDSEGKVIRSIGMVHDITERVQAEKTLQEYTHQLETYTHQLERSNQALQDFAYVASHDLREPLRKIQAFGELFYSRCQETIDAEGLSYLKRMRKAASRMEEMIDGLLAYSRVSTQGKPFQDVDMSLVAKGVIDDLDFYLEKTSGQVVVGELPTIQADSVQMHQLLLNLIANALKFHQADIPPVVRVESRKAEEGWVEISVADNGIGFSAVQGKQLFVPFHRLHGRTEFDGTGMGLSICRKIVERHGGEICAESEPGKGSVFTVRLPVSQLSV
jgi:PAS domain S-box-containing protein